jgi:type 1 glutamine amidotransferase
VSLSRRLAVLSLAILGWTCSVEPAWAQKRNPQGIPVLLLTGGAREHHGYRDQAFYLASLLEDTGHYRVTLCEDAALLTTPALKKYKILIVNADRRDPEFKLTEDQQRALLAAVKSGLGYVSIHGADNAAPDWLPEWREMLGGIFSHQGLPDGKTKKGTYTVKIASKASPITAGLSDFTIKDELYYHMQMQPNVEALATVSLDGSDWPVAWTRNFGDGRVFHTPLGHRDFGPNKDDPIRDPNLAKMVIQGVDWVAGR